MISFSRVRMFMLWGAVLVCGALFYGTSWSVYAAADCASLTGYVIPRVECDALVDFYNSTYGTGRSDKTGWVTNTSACTWTWVTCTSITGNSYVSEIELDNNNLSWTLNSSLGVLAHLTSIDLGENDIWGTLPEEWSGLTSLNTLYLDQNNLTWTLPSSRSVRPIQIFFIELNTLNGSFPESRSSWGDTIYDFVVGSNNFNGSLPDAYASWTGLYRFSAEGNQISWTFPVSRSGWDAIEVFYMYNSPNIEGTLPTERASWAPSIQHFGAWNGNSGMTGGISWTFPSAWSARTWLRTFYIGGAQITGTLPSSWSAWTQMNDFRVYDMPVRGEVPSSRTVRSWPQLFFLYNTYVNGSFATWFTDRTWLSSFRIHENCMLTTGFASGVASWISTYSTVTDELSQKRCLDITLDKSVSATTEYVWNTLIYTISYTFWSGTNVTWVRLYDIWDTGLNRVSSSLAFNGSWIYTWTLAASLSWSFAQYRDIQNIVRWSTNTITINAQISHALNGWTTLYNRVVTQDGLIEFDTGDNLDSVSTLLVSSPYVWGGWGSYVASSNSTGATWSGNAASGSTLWGGTSDKSTGQNQNENTKNTYPLSAAENPRNCTDTEFNDAYSYARALNITTMKDCMAAMMDGKLLRKHAAKMLTEFAMHVFKRVPDESRACTFSDMATEDKEMQKYVKAACQLGLMWLDGNGTSKETFSPNEYVTTAQAGTIISRILWWDTHNTSDACRYCDHLKALQDAGIMKIIDQPERLILRGWLMIMMERISR